MPIFTQFGHFPSFLTHVIRVAGHEFQSNSNIREYSNHATYTTVGGEGDGAYANPGVPRTVTKTRCNEVSGTFTTSSPPLYVAEALDGTACNYVADDDREASCTGTMSADTITPCFFDDSVWEETMREDHEPKNDKPGYSFVTLKRKTG